MVRSAAGDLAEVLVVRRPGLQTTVQDGGRAGYARYGVPSSGALDTLSLRLGNMLLDNPPAAAALELSLVGPELEALTAVTCAYTGADMGLIVGGHAVPPGRTFRVRDGEVLRFGSARSGARAYLCMEGGIAVPPVLGSSSTAVNAGIGGIAGRPLLGGDVLRARLPASPTPEILGRVLKPQFLFPLGPECKLRIVEGPQAPEMRAALEGLLAAEWRVSRSSNRIGIRLEGPPLEASAPNFETEGVPVGAVQTPPDGAPILLLADRQVTGGYPKPAVIASVDLPLTGQLRPGDVLRFELISVDEAVRLLREREDALAGSVFDERRPAEGSLPELLRVLEKSNIEEIHLESPRASFRWRR